LQKGSLEYFSEIITENGQKNLHFMYPFLATAGCVKNRPGQNLQVGEVMGGISIIMPLEPFEILREKQNRTLFITYGILWAIGALGISWGYFALRRRTDALLRAEKQAVKAYGELNQN
jgi:hypothetical protein